MDAAHPTDNTPTGTTPRSVTATIVEHGTDIATLRTITGDTMMMPVTEWASRDKWRKGDKVIAAAVNVGDTTVLSTTVDTLITALLEGHVPEVRDGTVRVMGIARQPGTRTKVAVAATNPDIDPVQACVGRAATRVRAVVEALNGERVDIVAWAPDPHTLVANAMAPAKVLQVRPGEDDTHVEAVVPRHQMAAAVGEAGLNSQLAGALAGVDVDVIAD